MWQYTQLTGELRDYTGRLVATGYAGGEGGERPEGRNNPDMQEIENVGPLPCGFYSFGTPVEHSKLGPFAIPLIPYERNQMFGRSAFFMHGDRVDKPGTASDGCIIMPPTIRHQCWNSTDHTLEVVSGKVSST